jgi:hypothetical protein
MDGLLEKGKQGVRGLVQPFPTIQVRCAAETVGCRRRFAESVMVGLVLIRVALKPHVDDASGWCCGCAAP